VKITMKKSKLLKTLARLTAELHDRKDEVESLRYNIKKREEWLHDAKLDAGYDQNVSFDIVWADALKLLLHQKSKNKSNNKGKEAYNPELQNPTFQ
jgi:hypothetical protein